MISDALRHEIMENEKEHKDGSIYFPKKLMQKYRNETADYYSSDIEICGRMINISYWKKKKVRLKNEERY